MDIQMPVMDGLSASRHIHEALGDRAPPIVAMTANVTSVDHHSSLAAGMVDHIGKPFDLDELVTVLSTHVGRVPRHRAKPAHLGRPRSRPPSRPWPGTRASTSKAPSSAWAGARMFTSASCETSPANWKPLRP